MTIKQRSCYLAALFVSMALFRLTMMGFGEEQVQKGCVAQLIDYDPKEQIPNGLL